MEVEYSVTIACPIDEVFRFVGSPDSDAEWGSLIVASAQLTSGPLGVGSVFEQTAAFLGVRTSVRIEVTEYEPDRIMRYRSARPVPLEHYRTVEARPDGTRLTFHTELDPPREFQLAAAVMRRAARHQMETDLEAIKARLEMNCGASGPTSR